MAYYSRSVVSRTGWHQHHRGDSGGVEIGEVEKGWFRCLSSELTQVAVVGLVVSDVITE
jgi:hypothetical protein